MRTPGHRPGRSLLILALATLASCASSGARLDQPLPFRVALMPVRTKEDPNLRAATPASFPEELPRLDLKEEDVTSAIVSALNGRGFTDVRTLTYPADSTEFATKTTREQFEYWMDQAAKARADILLDVEVLYEANIEGGINEKFWLNLPLFLLGGPFCYFINDRTYDATARLQAQFYSTLAPRDRDRAAVFGFPLQVDYTGSQLDFTDRAGKNLGAYALSLVVPAGLLVRNNERIAEAVRSEALEQLADALVEQLASQQEQFKENVRLAQFSLDMESASARRTPDGKVALSAVVRRGQNYLKRYEVRCDSVAEALDGGDLSESSDREQRIEGVFAVPASDNLIQLEIEDGNQRRRSYTFRVEPSG
jgi:hypothetical protein